MKKALLVSIDSDLGKAMYPELRDYEVVTTSRHGVENSIPLELGKPIDSRLTSQTFDLLIYNLGVSEVSKLNRVDIFWVNAIATYDVLKVLAKSIKDGGHIIVFTSGWGSIGYTIQTGGTGSHAYRMSKAALNMGVAMLSNEYPNLKWVLMGPGFVKTKMNTNPNNLPAENATVAMKGVLKVGLASTEKLCFKNYKNELMPF